MKTITILNHSNNPFVVEGVDGKPVELPLEGSVEVTEVVAKKLMAYKGLIDATKYVKPQAIEEELRKKNAALEAELKAIEEELRKKNAALEAELKALKEKAGKDK